MLRVNAACILAFLLSLSGCAANIVQATDNVVQAEHRTHPSSFRDARLKANEHCAKSNKIAVMDRQACHGAQCTTQFRCETK